MLNFDDEVIKFSIKGKSFEVSKPNNGQIKKYSQAYKEAKTDEEKENELMIFLDQLGLKKEAYELLTPTQSEKLIKALYEAEKN